ncbi:MAG: Trm112 family protein [DPANN group archaeon]|nr:Trm112 family protein [DPANN group archaeon]
MAELPTELLEIICCPMDKADLKYDKKAQTLTCKKCKYVYPIIDGIPDLRPPYMIEADKSK